MAASSDNIGGKLEKAPPISSEEQIHHRKPSRVIVAELTAASAQLRHAYAQLAAGVVVDQKEFADGLISPQIATLEKITRRLA